MKNSARHRQADSTEDGGQPMSSKLRMIPAGVLAMAVVSIVGCAHWGTGAVCDDACGGACEAPCAASCEAPCGCDTGGTCNTCGSGCGGCGPCGWFTGVFHRRSNAIPDVLPLGSTVRAHYQVMETNGEASDFIFHRHDFVGQTAELTPDGKDKILEVAVRMKSAPFPVLIERSSNNSDVELDLVRRNLVAQILTEFGTPDADRRTIISPTYSPGYNAIQAEPTYYRYLLQGGGGFGGGGGGGFGGGGFGGGGGGGFGGGGF